MKSILFGNSAVTFADAIYITVVSMLIVFFILFLISFVLSFFKYFSAYEEKNVDIENKKRNDGKILEKQQKLDSEQKFNMEKIKDETMLAAMMAALIEAAGDNKDSRIRIKNIREIK
ncbi:OadG family protein [Leptotrichia hongkongensis]|uniref:OadG family protein n=1 Tax=Leptotrichia hongkongensis TaxID=554406 RepID=UPI0035A93EF4